MLYADRPNAFMLPFAKKIDASVTLVNCRSEEDEDAKESSDDDDLDPNNQ